MALPTSTPSTRPVRPSMLFRLPTDVENNPVATDQRGMALWHGLRLQLLRAAPTLIANSAGHRVNYVPFRLRLMPN